MLDETTTLFACNVTETFSSQPLLVRKAQKFAPVFKLALFPRLWSAVCICMATTPGDTSEVQRARGMHASQLLIKLVGSRTSDAYANCEQVAPSHPHTLDYTHLSGCCFSTNPRNWSLSKNSLGRFKTVSWFFTRYLRTCFSEGFLLLEIFDVSDNDLLQFVQCYQQPVYVFLNIK